MTSRSCRLVTLLAVVFVFGASCSPTPHDGAPAGSFDHGLLVALAQFEVSPEGKALAKPGPARLEILVRRGGAWETIAIEDPSSNVFHKAMVVDDGRGAPAILTMSGSAAALKLWRRSGDGFASETIWEKDFGGKFSRMREAELLKTPDGGPRLAVATHDQGVVAIVSPDGAGGWSVREIDAQPDTFVHEIEIGDLDGDGKPEIYATPSEPNVLDGRAQSGVVVRYDPDGGQRSVVADLGDRHAKEILVSDVDGDGRDELYVSVEAVEGGRLEIRRYDAGTDPSGGQTIATLDDRLCRFLTAGDVDGDGKAEMVAAAHRSGLWLLRPPAGGDGLWDKTSIDRRSSGFEHAALLTDLDGDGLDELYVASDDQGEIRRYVWKDGAFAKEVIATRDVPESVFTWNLMPVPVSLVE